MTKLPFADERKTAAGFLRFFVDNVEKTVNNSFYWVLKRPLCGKLKLETDLVKRENFRRHIDMNKDCESFFADEMSCFYA